MITVKGNVVTFTGKDAANITKQAKEANLTPTQLVTKALEAQMALSKAAKKVTKRVKKA